MPMSALGVQGVQPGSILRAVASGYRPLEMEGPTFPMPALDELRAPALAPHNIQLPATRLLTSTAVDTVTPDRPIDKLNTLQMHLTELQSEDPEHVFIVRGISKMGFDSQNLLHAHYSAFGTVRRVMVTQSKVKPYRSGCQNNPRIRPGSLGFVVMDSKQSVARVLAAGAEQMVENCRIRVECYVQMRLHDEDATSSAAEASSDTRGGDTTGNHLASCDSASISRNSGKKASSSHKTSERSDSSAAEDLNSSPAAAVANKTSISELAVSLSKLVGIMSQSECKAASADFSGPDCAEALNLSRTAQVQLQGLLDQCSQRLGTLAQDGATRKEEDQEHLAASSSTTPWLPSGYAAAGLSLPEAPGLFTAGPGLTETPGLVTGGPWPRNACARP